MRCGGSRQFQAECANAQFLQSHIQVQEPIHLIVDATCTQQNTHQGLAARWRERAGAWKQAVAMTGGQSLLPVGARRLTTAQMLLYALDASGLRRATRLLRRYILYRRCRSKGMAGGSRWREQMLRGFELFSPSLTLSLAYTLSLLARRRGGQSSLLRTRRIRNHEQAAPMFGDVFAWRGARRNVLLVLLRCEWKVDLATWASLGRLDAGPLPPTAFTLAHANHVHAVGETWNNECACIPFFILHRGALLRGTRMQAVVVANAWRLVGNLGSRQNAEMTWAVWGCPLTSPTSALDDERHIRYHWSTIGHQVLQIVPDLTSQRC